jgi:hypothetical protein
LPKGTVFHFITSYDYGTAYTGYIFSCAEIVTGKYKGCVIDPSFLYLRGMSNAPNYKVRFDPAYAIEATPENVAKVRGERLN